MFCAVSVYVLQIGILHSVVFVFKNAVSSLFLRCFFAVFVLDAKKFNRFLGTRAFSRPNISVFQKRK